ncbi:transcription termination/antitermination protein NusA, partial [Streptococcus suis]
MSKEMLEAFRILEEDMGINKADLIDAVTESLGGAFHRGDGQSDADGGAFDA